MSFKIQTVIFLFYFLSEIKGGPVNYDVKDFLSNRIVGGIEAPPGYAKHMVALIYGEPIAWLSCGGSIITNRHVLSAAHCIEPFVYSGQLYPTYRGSVGTNYWNSTKYIIHFKSYVIHPEWNTETIKNDIGVLITEKEIVFNDVIEPVALNFEIMDEPVKSFVTGYGNPRLFGETPDRLQLLYTETITSQQCVEDVKNATNNLGSAPPHDPDVEICAFHSYGHGMCHGDSGSALVTFDGRAQIGVVSWGFACARGAPDMFARISAYSSWLTIVMSNIKVPAQIK